ncbi:MAG: hypothetical protein A2664_01255 [Candidatus Taylorbacteria bacterium RIFCSPHIGHO2_01_FULL_46_22b]|uniref:Uncharacterized protein n=1 Tax=Candidatus Taylorbacteria bacterium RIFCSPHIGHO2_01_FULL_46_22b TaxID=1802301 RepID=A0A1G2M4K2_9BACT|nr:MAG: hypothetical protein A2664_01255 [Candidatus Taylorbacteria bacterium RIFCSPHIGHO2_01_FULL_46_22b]
MVLKHLVGKTLLVLVLTALCSVSSTSAHAQLLGGNANPLILITIPAYPRPNSDVTVEVRSTSVEIDVSDIGWLEDGELSESGLGKTSHRTHVGDKGSSQTVTAIVHTPEGRTYEQTILIRPQSISLIWESSSSVPPFYRGKALYTSTNPLTITAIPEIFDELGEPISASQLSFIWKLNNKTLSNKSGYGKSSLSLTEPILRTPATISVTVQSRDGLSVTTGSLSIDQSQPLVLIYENSPLYGILFNQAILNTFTLRGTEAGVEAFPYFFSGMRQKLGFSWNVNGRDIEGLSSSYITLRNTTGQSGTATAFISITNPSSSFESAGNGFNINITQPEQ